MANHAATAARQLSEPQAARTSLARVVTLEATTRTRSLKTAEVVARSLRRLIVEGRLKEG